MVKFNLKKKVGMGLLATAMVVGAGTLVSHMAPEMVVWADEEEKPTITYGNAHSLTLDTNLLTGNYISVSYYTDEDCKKLKATTVYNKEEINNGVVMLGALNLKKGGYFKAYDENIGEDEVKAFKVDPQVGKVKAKVLNLAEDDFFKAVQIDVEGTTLTATNWKEYSIYIEGLRISENVGNSSLTADDFNTAWKQCKVDARLGGLTLTVRYNGKITTSNGVSSIPNGMPSEAKLKIKAAPKAPKVTIDYVNGTYAIPKGAQYVYTTVTKEDDVSTITIVKAGDDGKIANLKSASAKTSVSIDDVLTSTGIGTAAAPAESAAIVVWTEKDKTMKSIETVIKVDGLAQLTVGEPTGTNKEKLTVKFVEGTNSKDIAELTFSKTGVIIKAKADMAYHNGSTWVTLKSGKETKTEVAVAAGSDIKIKSLGAKATKTEAGKFGSAETPITNTYEEPKSSDDGSNGDNSGATTEQ